MTEQEGFWAGKFGTEYSRRNAGSDLLAATLALFEKALRVAKPPRDCIEFGANIGMNLRALRFPEIRPRESDVEALGPVDPASG